MRNNNAEVTLLLAREINSKENAILSLSLSLSLISVEIATNFEAVKVG